MGKEFKTVTDHKFISTVCHFKGCQYLVLKRETDAIQTLLPETFYADRDLVFRIERLVDNWQRAIKTNLELEARLDIAQCSWEEGRDAGAQEAENIGTTMFGDEIADEIRKLQYPGVFSPQPPQKKK